MVCKTLSVGINISLLFYLIYLVDSVWASLHGQSETNRLSLSLSLAGMTRPRVVSQRRPTIHTRWKFAPVAREALLGLYKPTVSSGHSFSFAVEAGLQPQAKILCAKSQAKRHSARTWSEDRHSEDF